MIKKIIVINGSGGVGKDLFINFFIQNFCTNINKKVFNISTVDIIKEAAKILGWNGDKDERSRKFLSDLKFLASEYNNCSFNYVNSQINQLNVSNNEIVFFIHCREPEEIKKFKIHYDDSLIILLITRPGVLITSNEADGNVLNYNYDYIIDNNLDFEHFNKECKKFIDAIFK